MSAMLAVTKPDCIHVLADASFYDKDGTLTAFHPKVLKMPRANAVFASRGRDLAFPLFLMACEKFDYHSFDEFVRHAVEDVFKVMDRVFAEVAPGEGFEIIVAGWSDKRGRGEVLYHTSADRPYNAPPAGAVYLLGDVAGFGVVADASAAEFDPHVHGLTAFDEARRTLCDLSCGLGEPVMGHSVGGYLNHAVVTPAGVKWDVLQFWPDTIGGKIAPDGEILEEGWWDRQREAA